MSTEEEKTAGKPGLLTRLWGGLGLAGFQVAGRSSAVAAGWIFMVSDTCLTFTLCGAMIGVPLFAFGFLLVLRRLF